MTTNHNHRVGMLRWLRDLDRRIVARRDARYDVPRPWWVRYSFLANLPLLLLVPTAIRSGGAWWPPAGLAVAFWCSCLAALLRWERTHRRRPADEFEIAVDRL